MSTADWQVIALAALAGLLFAIGVWILFQHRDTPDKRERKRRLKVSTEGRLGDGMVTDIGPGTLYYSYAVGGVEYRASQDVTQLLEFLPAELEHAIGPVTLKYSSRNPANSIVVCEIWSGVRTDHKETVSR